MQMNERIISKLSIIKNAVEMGCLRLNDWEIGFIDSIEIWISQEKLVTWNQSKVINRIYERIE